MKAFARQLKRGLSMLLALAMAVSLIAEGGVIIAHAEEPALPTVSDGAIIAENYGELTAQEKALLNSGLLAGDTHAYEPPMVARDLVTVDADQKVITVANYTALDQTWIPVSVTLVADGEAVERLTLSPEGVAGYTYQGNAFSVEVEYTLRLEVEESRQQDLLSTSKWLKEGVDALEIIADQGGALYTLEAAMPELVNLANTGIALPFGGTVTLSDEAKGAVNGLNSEMKGNGGKLKLSTVAAEYPQYPKTEYLLTKGGQTYQDLQSFMERLSIVGTALNTITSNLDSLVNFGIIDASLAKQVKTLNGIVSGLNSSLSVAAAKDWTGAERGVSLVKADMTREDYLALDSYVVALEGTTLVELIRNPLDAVVVTLRQNMSMNNVTVTVVLNGVGAENDSDALVDYATTEPLVLTLASGLTGAEVAAAVAKTGVEQRAVAEWIAAGLYDPAHYEVEISGVEGTLESDADYTITYKPRNYTVTFAYASNHKQSVPYGYRLTLPVFSTAERVYDYTVNGSYVAQGTVQVITGDTVIDRVVDRPYTKGELYQIVANLYSNPTEYAVLTSGALYGDEAVDVRYPNKDKVEDFITFEDGVLTAENCPSGYHGLVWVPYSYTLVSGSDKTEHLFQGKNTVTIDDDNLERVDVVYILELDALTETETLELINLPLALHDQALLQKDALDSLARYTDQMKMLDRTKLGALGGVIEYSGLSDEMKAYFKQIVGEIITNCVDSNGYLKVYNLLAAYEEPTTGGLTYYYRNSGAFIGEIEALSKYLSAMVADGEKQAALQQLVSEAGYADYADKITQLEGAVNQVKESLIPPHSAIHTGSDNLYKLTEALFADGFTSYTKLDQALALYTPAYSVSATTTAFLSYEVVVGEVTYVTEPVTLEKTDVVTPDHVTTLLERVEAIVAEKIPAGDMEFYTTDYDAAALRASLEGLTGLEAMRLINQTTLHWNATEYEVQVEGMEPQLITVNRLQIKLAVSPTVDERYEYEIDGQIISGADSYAFTRDQLRTLFVEGPLVVGLTVQSVRRENLITMVDKLNAAVNNDTVLFALVEYAGDYSIVMRVDASNSGTLQSSMMSAAMGLVNSGYSYIALDNQPVLYLDENFSLQISLQSVVDALLISGTGTDTLIAAMDANGNINHMTLDGRIISLVELPNLGAELLPTQMQLGNNAQDATNVNFYITLGGASDQMVSLRNQLEGELGEYFHLVCEDGEAKVTLTLPEQVYQTYLSMLLLTDGLELTDMDAVNGRIAFTFLQDLLAPVLVEEVSVQAYLNSLEMLGLITDAQSQADYEAFYDYLCLAYDGMTFSYDDQSCLAVGNLPVKELLDSTGGSLGEMVRMVKEYETGVEISTRITLTNIGTQYNALCLDLGSGTMSLTTLGGDVAFNNPVVLVLLDNMDGSVTFREGGLLNLNGKQLRGDIHCGESVSIVDSSMVAVGGVTGAITGSYIKSNQAYSTLVRESTGDLTLQLNAALLTNEWTEGELQALVTDLLADLMFNGYASSRLSLDGNEIYAVEVTDLVGLLTQSDAGGRLFEVVSDAIDADALTAVLNDALDRTAQFGELERAVRSGAPLLSYQLDAAPWQITLRHVKDGDYITCDIVSGAVTGRTLNVVVVGSDADQAILADLLEVLDNTTTLDSSVTVTKTVSGSDLRFDWDSRSDMEIDMTGNVQYAIAVSLLLADGMGAPENAALVAGIRSYYQTRSLAKLEQAFHEVTGAQAIRAIGALDHDRALEDILADWDLTELAEFDRINMDAILAFMKQVATVIDDSGAVGKDVALGSYHSADVGGYRFLGEDSVQTQRTPLFEGYTFTTHTTTRGGEFILKLFSGNLMEYDIVVYKGSDDPVYEGSDLSTAFGKILGHGYTVRINARALTMEGSIMVGYQVTIKGADAIDQAGYSFLLAMEEASIHSDAKLAVYSSTDGYIVKRSGKYDYTLREVAAPVTSAPVAESWMDTLTSGGQTTRYLFLDLNPTEGMTFDALVANMKFKDLTGYDLTVSMVDNDGGELVKNNSRMLVEVQSDGVIETFITYTVIVMGDTNCTGAIESGDAVVMQDIYNGNARNYDHAILLAADCNKTGTVAFPAVESGDAVRIMHKYFDWESYLDSLRKQ